MVVDELALARIKQEELTKRERDLGEEVSRTRMEIEANGSRIEDLARANAPINLLPPEILSYVLELVAFPMLRFPRHFRPIILGLAKVSSAWRNIIFNSPKFWNHIDFDPRADMSFVKEHVERSCQYPLDIAIRYMDADSQLSTLMDVIVPHVHRWRTLEIFENFEGSLELILGKINHLKFPSLFRVIISSFAIEDMQYPTFLRPENSPSLKSLQLDNLTLTDELLPGKGVTDLSLKFSSHPFGPLVLSSLLSPQQLTTLKLVYSTSLSLQPESISLPSLTSLTLEAKHPRGLISAIIAPRLTCFCLITPASTDQLSTAFHGFESKFPNVHHFEFHANHGSTSIVDAECVSAVFPNVRHVKLHTTEVDDFFRMGVDDSGSCPADNWQWLESLTFNEMKICHPSSTNHFIQWLHEWNSDDLPMLHVKFTLCIFHSEHGNASDFSTPRSLLYLHNALREICILDLRGVAVRASVFMSLTSASPPQLVCLCIK